MLHTTLSVLVYFEFFQANELGNLGVESEFCWNVVGDHCDTQENISSSVSSKCVMFNGLLAFSIATRIPLNHNLNQYYTACGWLCLGGPSHSFLAFIHCSHFISKFSNNRFLGEVLFFHSLSLPWHIWLVTVRACEMLLLLFLPVVLFLFFCNF